MAVSEVAICNSALIKLGAERIADLNDESKEAQLCKEQYPKMRDDVLESHPWNFALKRVALAATANTPVWEYDREFLLPVDHIRVVKTDLNRNEKWTVEGNVLLANVTSINIRYIFKEADTSRFSKMFDEALALRLASDLAYPIVQSVSLARSMFELYQNQLSLARSADGQVGFADRQVEANLWADKRF